jgi:hypothetical protein
MGLLVWATLPAQRLDRDARPEYDEPESGPHGNDDHRREHGRALQTQLEDERDEPDHRRTGGGRQSHEPQTHLSHSSAPPGDAAAPGGHCLKGH